MTPRATNDLPTLRNILARTTALLLDFDGPVCSVFSGLPATTVVSELCVVLADGGHTDLPAQLTKSDDPFEVLVYAATLGQTEAHYVNAVAHVSARTTPDPALLKPNPHLLTTALSALGVPADAAAFLGDSTTDITAAHAAGTMSIGYTNKPGKTHQLVTAGADVVINSPATITQQIPTGRR